MNVLTWPAPVEGEIVCHAILQGEPAAKTRARFAVSKTGQVRTYNLKAANEAQTAVAWAIKAALNMPEPDANATFGVRAAFVSGVLIRRDVDNMLKLVMDAATGVVWGDDYQVSEIHARIVRDDPDARTEMLFYRTGTVAKRTTPCLVCGAPMKAYPSWKGERRFCSAPCRKTGLTGKEQPCASCARPIYVEPNTAGRTKYCSRRCVKAVKTIALTCTYCRRPFTRPRSLAKGPRTYCNPGCFYADRREKVAHRHLEGVLVTVRRVE